MLRAKEKEEEIREFYRLLFRAWGRQHWWPAATPFEVIAGAILTQNTAWTNVERAMANLRSAGVLSLEGIRKTGLEELGVLIRSAGYFRQKAQRLKVFVSWLDERYGGSLEGMFSRATGELRAELLGLNGIGPETADSILLYAGNHPGFVVDAYTRRVLERHRILPATAKYDAIRELFEGALADFEFVRESEALLGGKAGARGTSHPPSGMSTSGRSALAQVFNEMHGLMVGVGKNYCLKARALCDECPLAASLRRKPKEYRRTRTSHP